MGPFFLWSGCASIHRHWRLPSLQVWWQISRRVTITAGVLLCVCEKGKQVGPPQCWVSTKAREKQIYAVRLAVGTVLPQAGWIGKKKGGNNTISGSLLTIVGTPKSFQMLPASCEVYTSIPSIGRLSTQSIFKSSSAKSVHSWLSENLAHLVQCSWPSREGTCWLKKKWALKRCKSRYANECKEAFQFTRPRCSVCVTRFAAAPMQ